MRGSEGEGEKRRRKKRRRRRRGGGDIGYVGISEGIWPNTVLFIHLKYQQMRFVFKIL